MLKGTIMHTNLICMYAVAFKFDVFVFLSMTEPQTRSIISLKPWVDSLPSGRGLQVLLHGHGLPDLQGSQAGCICAGAHLRENRP